MSWKCIATDGKILVEDIVKLASQTEDENTAEAGGQ